MKNSQQNIPFVNRYIHLGESFYVKTEPTEVSNPELIIFNNDLAEELGLTESLLNSKQATSIFAGNHIPEGAAPLAMAYSGHQFGQFNPQLGDGRAILLGEITAPNQQSYCIQLKGSGQTFYSRRGDGRAALGPVLREYLISEAMVKLGVPTTRALAAVTTGDQVQREQAEPGAIITRVATSFVRVGTFQYFAANEDHKALKALADHVIEHNYSFLLKNPSGENKQHKQLYTKLLESVIDRQASLVAKWMQLGFIHGVMNTDNMSIAGETIDYGPCAFMDHFAHKQVFSAIDQSGLYSYKNQPTMAMWNLTRFAESLLSILAETPEAAVDIAKAALQKFTPLYQSYWLKGMQQKLGLSPLATEKGDEEDKSLIETLLDLMQTQQADFTLTFYHLSRVDSEASKEDESIKALFNHAGDFNHWLEQWRLRLKKEPQTEAQMSVDKIDKNRQEKMQAVNPVYIPRNHQIAAAIKAAEQGDFALFHQLHQLLQTPYQEQTGQASYMQAPNMSQVVTQTFCGT